MIVWPLWLLSCSVTTISLGDKPQRALRKASILGEFDRDEDAESARRVWSCIGDEIARASPVLTRSFSKSKLSNLLTMALNWKGISNFSASSDKTRPICSITSFTGCTPVIRRCGGPSGRALRKATFENGNISTNTLRARNSSAGDASLVEWRARLPPATWPAHVSKRWIKYKPLSSDFSSFSHGYGDPGETETPTGKACSGDDDVIDDDDPSS
nr:hypothetical protein Iba_chr08bCG1550 [Ipomoea batatas]